MEYEVCISAPPRSCRCPAPRGQRPGGDDRHQRRHALTGATGVSVNGSLYDVEFLDGTCISVFGGCDSDSDFAFSSAVAAKAAGQALIDQVFLGGFADPALTAGCGLFVCYPWIPYAQDPEGVFAAGVANEINSDFEFSTGLSVVKDWDFALVDSYTWARFTTVQATAVPEPSSWTLMLAGFGAIGLALRRGRKRTAKAAFS